MRKLTKNELIELRACREMDNPEYEFYTRAKRMYEGDAEAVEKIQKLEDLFNEMTELGSQASDPDAKVYQGYTQVQSMYFGNVNELLKEMGYTPKPKRTPNDIFDVLEDMFGKPDE